MKKLLPLFLLLVSVFTFAGEGHDYKIVADGVKATAQSYMAAYEKMDYEKMATFYTDESTYQDLATASIQELNGAKEEEGASCSDSPRGQAAIKEKLKTGLAEIKDLKFEMKSQFYVGSFAVHTVRASATVPVQDLPPMNADLDMVVVLEIKDNKVINHFSLSDVERAMTLMAQHRNTYSANN